MIARALARALEQATEAFESAEPARAASALEEAARMCSEAEASRASLGAADLAKLQELHERCDRAASRAGETLRHLIAQAGCARRALDAYVHAGP